MSSLETTMNDSEEKLEKHIIDLGICKDNFIGTLSIGKGDKNFSLKNAHLNFAKDDRKNKGYDIPPKSENKRLIIILESPHTDEFEDEFIAPALGRTGNSLDKYFLEILHKYFSHNLPPKEGNYEVILMNAVQYQCSAGLPTKLYRDFFWLKFWFKGKKKSDFVSRLKKYKPDIVINLCTKGCHDCDPNLHDNPKVINRKYLQNRIGLYSNDYPELQDITSAVTLQSFVDKSIISAYPNIPIIEGPHPLSWIRNKKTRHFGLITPSSPNKGH